MWWLCTFTTNVGFETVGSPGAYCVADGCAQAWWFRTAAQCPWVSNTFQHKNSSGRILNCYFTDDGYGIINLFTSVGGSQVLVASNIGTIDYDTGILSLNSTFVPVGYVSNDYISITAKPSEQDVLARENTIITIDSFDDSVTCSVITSTDRRDNIGTY